MYFRADTGALVGYQDLGRQRFDGTVVVDFDGLTRPPASRTSTSSSRRCWRRSGRRHTEGVGVLGAAPPSTTRYSACPTPRKDTLTIGRRKGERYSPNEGSSDPSGYSAIRFGAPRTNVGSGPPLSSLGPSSFATSRTAHPRNSVPPGQEKTQATATVYRKERAEPRQSLEIGAEPATSVCRRRSTLSDGHRSLPALSKGSHGLHGNV